MRFLTVITLSCFFLNAWGQIDFEKGYWINNDGIRNDCLIKNGDWYANPNKIWYKNAEGSDPILLSVSEIKELGVGEAKFIRTTVDIDTSSNRLSELSIRYSPEWKEETLFLRVLVEGKASLYYYRGDNTDRYFFSLDHGKIIQLVYKQYATSPTQVGTNRSYQGQLQAAVSCGTTPEKIKQVKYEGRPLTKHFSAYNICNGEAPQEHNEHRKMVARLKLVTGLDVAQLRINNGVYYTGEYPRASNARLGAELELAMPFNKGKWSMFLEPTYQSYHPKNVKYQSVEISLGARYYIFLSSQSKLYLNVSMVHDIPIRMEATGDFKSKESSLSASGGIGFTYRRFSLEGRQYSKRITYISTDAEAVYQKFSILLGFRIF